jgi:hypothetical protein
VAEQVINNIVYSSSSLRIRIESVDWCGSACDTVARYFGHGSKVSCSIKNGEFL